MIPSDYYLLARQYQPRVLDRAFDFSRVVTWPDTLRIRRELDAARAMHDEAMNGNKDGD